MAKTGRPGLSREKKTELWERWKSGQCASDIARALERTKGAINVPEVVEPKRNRGSLHLPIRQLGQRLKLLDRVFGSEWARARAAAGSRVRRVSRY
jgi:hypothetical protein